MKFLLILVATFTIVAAGSLAPGLRSKVRVGMVTEAILELPQVVDQLHDNEVFQFLTGDARADAVASILEEMSSAVQAPYVTIIKSLPGLSIEQFWASNIILIKGLAETSLDTLAAMQGDFLLREQITVTVNDVILDHNVTITTESAQWGVARIRAPAAWTVTQGAGCIVNIVDTGVSLDHEALADAWEGGWKGMYSYYNPPSPIDRHGHGSHVTGTILGRTNGVGVAPAAQWIACQGLNHQGSGTEAALIGCAQWSIIYRPKPHVSSNCWGGGSVSPWYDSSITAMRAADIIPVFAIGNSGPNCGTANSPGDRPNVISVGATTPTDVISICTAL